MAELVALNASPLSACHLTLWFLIMWLVIAGRMEPVLLIEQSLNPLDDGIDGGLCRRIQK